MDNKDVCRVFTFYSNFLPAITEEQYWKYCAFGAIDGIDVEEDIAEEGSEILECIRNSHTKFQVDLKGRYNAERLYGIRSGDKEKEREFWEEKKCPEYPFLFFTRAQCAGEKEKFLSADNRSRFEEEISSDGKLQIMTYLTYGNSDLFFVIKARFYEDGLRVIREISRGKNLIFDSQEVCYLKNSFSIAAVQHQWIDNMKEQQRNELKERKIECVYIKIIRELNEDVGALVQAIKDKKFEGIEIQSRSILGVDDEQITIRNISWVDFLSLYSQQEERGIFCNSNTKHRNVWAGLTTTIQVELEDTEECCWGGIDFQKNSDENEKIKKEREKLKEQYEEKKKLIEKKLNKIRKKARKKQEHKFKEINIILNSVPRYAGGLFNDYVFFSILPSLDYLLDLIQENLDRGINMQDYYDFLKAFCMYVQGSLASDRHSIQAIDFNSKIYEVPVKMMAFYSAHINFVKRILSGPEKDNKYEYEFLVAPGISDVVHVDELYSRGSDTKRLMKVEIPEYCLYSLHDMMIILTHETAHYVGRKYRLRDVRYWCILKSFSHVFVSYVRSWCLEKAGLNLQGKDENDWKTAEERMGVMLHRALERKKDEKYVSKVENRPSKSGRDPIYDQMIKINENYGEHMSQLRMNIPMAMIDIVQYGLKNIFGPVLYRQKYPEDLFFCIKQAAERYIVIHESGSTLISSQTTMEMLSMIYEEGFADLMAILILQMKAEEYVEGLLEEITRQGGDIGLCSRSDILYRIGIVLQCCIRDEKCAKAFGTEVSKYIESEKQGNLTDAEKLIVKALKTLAKKSEREPKPEKYHENLKNVLRDKEIVDKVENYLLDCCDAFHKDNQDASEELESIRTVFKQYSCIQKTSAEKQIIELMKVIQKYREYVLNNNG